MVSDKHVDSQMRQSTITHQMHSLYGEPSHTAHELEGASLRPLATTVTLWERSFSRRIRWYSGNFAMNCSANRR